jgi:hypothetical protein
MSYSLSLLAPNLLRLEMRGHVDKETAENYYSEAWDMLDRCPSDTNILINASGVNTACPMARNIIEKVKHHPNVGMYFFVVSQPYILLFSPIVKFFGGIHIFGSEEEALSFLQQESLITPTQASP